MDDGGKTPEEIEQERKAMKQQLDRVLDVCLPRIKGVQHFVDFTTEVNTRTEYALVIRIGQAGEARIDQLRKELEEREQLELKLKELEDKILLQKDGPTDEQKKLIDQIHEAQDKLPVEFDDKETLDAWTLEIAELVINAAKIEDNDEVLRVQTTLAFKVETTPERWDKVKMLTSEQEWEDVKKELVVYLLKASTNPEEKNYIDPTVKMDLLLAEGWVKLEWERKRIAAKTEKAVNRFFSFRCNPYSFSLPNVFIYFFWSDYGKNRWISSPNHAAM